jgi:hypothetical protein
LGKLQLITNELPTSITFLLFYDISNKGSTKNTPIPKPNDFGAAI